MRQVRRASIAVIAAYRAFAEFSDSELDIHYKKEFLDTTTRTRTKKSFVPRQHAYARAMVSFFSL